MTTARPFSPAEQYGFTTGLCAVFARAVRDCLGAGRIVVLNATDRRTRAVHDWPADEPLHLHTFVLLSDGTAVDAEGQRPLADLLMGFGVGRGYRYELLDDPDLAVSLPRAGALAAAWSACVLEQMQARGWGPTALPPATNALAARRAFEAAARAWSREALANYEARVAQIANGAADPRAARGLSGAPEQGGGLPPAARSRGP